MPAGDAVKKQKAESEKLAAVLAKGGDPTSVPVPFALRYLQVPITLNQGLLAGINGSIGAPHTPVTLGPEHGSSHHAPWGEPGQVVTCLEAGRMALRAELANGLHGGRETWGYADMYGVIYSLAAAHADEECRRIGRQLLNGWLAVFYLLRGHKMGCRSGVVLDESSVVPILSLLAGGDPRISKQDHATAARVFKVLLPVLDLPTIRNDDEAAAVLRDSGVRCLLGWEWVYYGNGEFGAAILDPGRCIKKGTGAGNVMHFDGRTGRPVESLRSGLRSLHLGPSGLSLFGAWSLPDHPPPVPEPPPEEPGEEEEQEPRREYPLLAEARAKAEELHGKLSRRGEQRLALEIRQLLRRHAIRELGLVEEEDA